MNLLNLKQSDAGKQFHVLNDIMKLRKFYNKYINETNEGMDADQVYNYFAVTY